jgi:hypothetical protein
VELISEHRSPFRDPPLVRARFDKNQRCPSRRDLRRFRFSGSISVARLLIFPGLPGHRPALEAGLRVSGVSFSE